jgi:hypothetical protein
VLKLMMVARVWRSTLAMHSCMIRRMCSALPGSSQGSAGTGCTSQRSATPALSMRGARRKRRVASSSSRSASTLSMESMASFRSSMQPLSTSEISASLMAPRSTERMALISDEPSPSCMSCIRRRRSASEHLLVLDHAQPLVALLQLGFARLQALGQALVQPATSANAPVYRSNMMYEKTKNRLMIA